MTNEYHTPVLVDEVLECLINRADGIYVDATVGGGGHAEAILQQLSPQGRLIGFDADADAIRRAGERLSKFGNRVLLLQANFSGIRQHVAGLKTVDVNGVLFDLGVSSFQLDERGKGFSFMRDEQLDMRMDKRQQLDAETLLRTEREEELERIFRDYGEERYARKIAKAIVHERKTQPVQTTGHLASIVENVVGSGFGRKSLARIFQALRIAVNDELNNLRVALEQVMDILTVGGRIVVISYHSLEDRIVKEFFKAEATSRIPSAHKIVPDQERISRLRLLTKKPVTPMKPEVNANRRARSAKLRAAERI